MEMFQNPASTPTDIINTLPEHVILKIFQSLSAEDRLLASEVCRRWYDISRLLWTDVKVICLSSIIQSERLIPIFRQCPNIRSVTGFGPPFGRLRINPATAHRIFEIIGRNLTSLCIYNPERNWINRGYSNDQGFLPVDCFYDAKPVDFDNPICGERLREFIWHNEILAQGNLYHCFCPPHGNAITHLQLSGCVYRLPWGGLEEAFGNLRQLESFILANQVEFYNDEHWQVDRVRVIESFSKLTYLKELLLACSGFPERIGVAACIATAATMSMRKLQRLTFGNYTAVDAKTLKRLVAIPSLKMLMLAGCDYDFNEPTVILPREARTRASQLSLFYNTTAILQPSWNIRIECANPNVLTMPVATYDDVLEILKLQQMDVQLQPSWISERIAVNTQKFGVQWLDGERVSDDGYAEDNMSAPS